MNASPITKITSWLKFLGKNLHFVGCATLCAKSEVMLVHISRYGFLIFCVEFRELSHLIRDLSQAEKEINVVTSSATDKMTTIFNQNDNSDHFE